MSRLAFCWPGLPDYAARCIRAVIERGNVPVSVVATRPNIPIEGMELSLGRPITWINSDETKISWSHFGLQTPTMLLTGGYSVPAFNSLASQVRRDGGVVILMSDNNWTGSARQRIIDPLRHRILFRNRFDAVFVPGASGERVARSWGYAPSQIATGLYGADDAIFNGGKPLKKRPKTFLFVGQFIARKNVLGLVNAFTQFALTHPDWSLELCGIGDQSDEIQKHPRVRVSGFVQPDQLAERLRGARCLILPSVEEHWGLVVHEATLCGCALGLSWTVGASVDLAKPENALLFQPRNNDAIGQTLREFAGWEDDQWDQAEQVSREVAEKFGPHAFAKAVDTLFVRLNGVQA